MFSKNKIRLILASRDVFAFYGAAFNALRICFDTTVKFVLRQLRYFGSLNYDMISDY